MATELERIASLETAMMDMRSDVGEIKGDVKILVADRNRQKGMAAVAMLLWTVIAGGLGFFFRHK